MTRHAAPLLALLCAGSFAQAADLPSRKAPPQSYLSPAPVYTWTGLYVGSQAGYVGQRYSQREFDLTNAGLPTSNNTSWTGGGVAVGVHAGYNAQMSQLVFGVEGDLEGSTTRGSQGYLDPTVAGFTQSWSIRNYWRGAVRGRVGYAMDRFMPYIAGGLAFGGFKSNLSNWGSASENASTTRVGWTIGAGMEYAFDPALSARLEYRYTDFGQFSQTSTLAFPGNRYQNRVSDHSVRVGLSYHFNPAPAAIVAKY